MLGHFAACPANAVGVGSIIILFSRGRSIVPHSPSLCTVHVSFPWRPVGSLPRAVVHRTGPPFPSLFSSFVNMVARMPASSSGPPLLSFISPSAARTGSAPCFRSYLRSMHRLCIPSPPQPPPVCCFFFLSVHLYKYPWSLLFVFIPIPPYSEHSYKI